MINSAMIILPFTLLVGSAWQPIIWRHLGLPWMSLVVAFLLFPLADYFFGCSWRAFSFPAFQARWLPRSYVLLQVLLMSWAATIAAKLSLFELLEVSLAVGTITGGLGITAAHEMGHRVTTLDKFLARALLCSVGYGQFLVEHIRGHHVRVGTDGDPTSAPQGMDVYRFALRAVSGTWRHAWELETMRLRRRGLKPFHWRNEVLVSNIVSLMLLSLISAAFGAQAGLLLSLQAAWAVFLLESVDYVEHYGLRREVGPNGLERVKPEHSWNANFMLSNMLLFNLQLHSDHHVHMNKPWEAQVSCEDAPQLPASYFTMLPVAWMPKLWFSIMDPRLESWRRAREARLGRVEHGASA